MPKKNKANKLVKPDWIRATSMPTVQPVELRRFTIVQALTFDTTGKSVNGWNAAVLRANSAEWSSYAARFQQYRILRIKVTLVPPADTASGQESFYVLTAIDRTGAMANPTTIGQIGAMQESKLFNGALTVAKPITVSATATDLEDMNYTPVGTSSSAFQLFTWVQNHATGSGYSAGLVKAEYWVELKGNQ